MCLAEPKEKVTFEKRGDRASERLKQEEVREEIKKTDTPAKYTQIVDIVDNFPTEKGELLTGKVNGDAACEKRLKQTVTVNTTINHNGQSQNCPD